MVQAEVSRMLHFLSAKRQLQAEFNAMHSCKGGQCL